MFEFKIKSRAGSASFRQRRTARCCFSNRSLASLSIFWIESFMTCNASVVFVQEISPYKTSQHRNDGQRGPLLLEGHVLGLTSQNEDPEYEHRNEWPTYPEYNTLKHMLHLNLLDGRRNVQHINNVRLDSLSQGQAI